MFKMMFAVIAAVALLSSSAFAQDRSTKTVGVSAFAGSVSLTETETEPTATAVVNVSLIDPHGDPLSAMLPGGATFRVPAEDGYQLKITVSCIGNLLNWKRDGENSRFDTTEIVGTFAGRALDFKPEHAQFVATVNLDSNMEPQVTDLLIQGKFKGGDKRTKLAFIVLWHSTNSGKTSGGFPFIVAPLDGDTPDTPEGVYAWQMESGATAVRLFAHKRTVKTAEVATSKKAETTIATTVNSLVGDIDTNPIVAVHTTSEEGHLGQDRISISALRAVKLMVVSNRALKGGKITVYRDLTPTSEPLSISAKTTFKVYADGNKIPVYENGAKN